MVSLTTPLASRRRSRMRKEFAMRWLLKRYWFWLIFAIVLALFCYVSYEIDKGQRPLREKHKNGIKQD